MKRLLLVLLGCAVFAGSASATSPPVEDYDPTARQKPMPVITKLDKSIADDAWVIIVHELDNARAPQLVPILRPLVPQNGHLVAHSESNTVMIADSYANIRKLIEIIRIIDSATPRQQRE